MDNRLHQLLNELYELDPALRSRESDLIAIISAMLKAAPTVEIDPAFRTRLRQTIDDRIRQTSTKRASWPWFTPRAWLLAVPAAAAVALVFWPSPQTTPSSTDRGPTIVTRGEEAFGNFSTGQSAAIGSIRNQAGGGVALDTSRIAPEVIAGTRYEYTFAGEVPKVTLPVLRRQSGLPTNALAGLMGSGLTDLLDLQSFSGLTPQQITINEAGDTGYSLTLDFQNGWISVSKLASGQAEKPVTITAPSVRETPKKIDVPSDQEVVEITDAWLKKYGINRQSFGEPIVRKDWMQWLATADAATRESYVPSDLTVVYPWVVNTIPVVDESGQPYGLTVNVSVATRTVTYLSNLAPLRFESSTYKLTTDLDAIRAILKRGGLYSYQPAADSGITTAVTEVGTPSIAYTINRYQLEQGPVDYLVPALIFPVPSGTASGQPSAIVIPVVQQLIDQALSPAQTEPGTGSNGAAIEPSSIDTVR